MLLEFQRAGKTYVCAVGSADTAPPPARLAIAFRACAFQAPFILELAYLGRDPARGLELYEALEPAPEPVDD
jgi:hypothetical protein